MEVFYDILKQLIRVPSVTGHEHSFFMFLKRELEDLNIAIEYYDGVLVAKGKKLHLDIFLRMLIDMDLFVPELMNFNMLPILQKINLH